MVRALSLTDTCAMNCTGEGCAQSMGRLRGACRALLGSHGMCARGMWVRCACPFCVCYVGEAVRNTAWWWQAQVAELCSALCCVRARNRTRSVRCTLALVLRLALSLLVVGCCDVERMGS